MSESFPVSSIEDFTTTNFDFLIAGGGTAGLTIAARLTENPNVTVGVIEAGKYKINDPLIDTPTAFLQTFENPDYDWCMYTSPQAANRGRTHHIPRGKVLGGSSAINYLMYVRGSLQDYDDWAALAGDEGWSARSMMGYMRKHQTLEPIDPATTTTSATTAAPCIAEFHGTTGPIHTTFNASQLPVETDFIKASAQSTDLPNKPLDAWSGDHIGFYHTLGTVTRTGPNKGKRSYAGRDYYVANSARPNLKLLCEANVDRVILDGTRATGVGFTFRGREYEVSATREVIVSGGTIKSPQILELSGIGDPDVLSAAGIDVKVANRAVGANVQDHVLALVGFHTLPDVVTLETLAQFPEAMQAVVKEYAETGGGALSAIGSTQGFFPAKKILSDAELESIVQSIRETKPVSEFHAKQLDQIIAHLQSDISANLQVVFLTATVNPAEGVEHQSKIFATPPAGQPGGVTMALCLQYPVARGSIHVQSSDPTAPPIINPNYISHEADVTLLAAFARWADQVGTSDAVKNTFAGRYYPGESVNLQDLEQAKEAVRDTVVGEYHICGSVGLGDALDSKLRVKGVEGLRVADASVFPNNVSGNIVSSVYAVAERAADLIKEEYGLA
ncbi:hypothetical protein HK57_00094 [Aspergillus ustus]|uniref:Glucose-methanol-choline oxidoreductase N-terminal domain-containing protein n=1 Tax=Aspergillus ustus TaxID=40382 RepID=A0A0C1C349_ASPUT|nr:hypothetical protein HK57_00094 [Aspergillus ustus]